MLIGRESQREVMRQAMSAAFGSKPTAASEIAVAESQRAVSAANSDPHNIASQPNAWTLAFSPKSSAPRETVRTVETPYIAVSPTSSACDDANASGGPASPVHGIGAGSHLKIHGDEKFTANVQAALGALDGLPCASVLSSLTEIRQTHETAKHSGGGVSGSVFTIRNALANAGKHVLAGALVHDAQHAQRPDLGYSDAAETDAFTAEAAAYDQMGKPGLAAAARRDAAKPTHHRLSLIEQGLKHDDQGRPVYPPAPPPRIEPRETFGEVFMRELLKTPPPRNEPPKSFSQVFVAALLNPKEFS